MKKTLLVIAVLFLTTLISQAQTEKGGQTLGLNFGFTYSKGNAVMTDPNSGGYYKGNNQITNFNIGPTYSYFIADKTDIGGYFSYSSINSTSPYFYPNGEVKSSGHAYSGGIFLRKYFMFDDKIGVRTGPYLYYTRNNSGITYSQPYSISNGSNVGETGGIGMQLDLVYYPVKNLGVTAHLADLGFFHYTSRNSAYNSSSGNSVDFNLISSALSLSVVYAFGK